MKRLVAFALAATFLSSCATVDATIPQRIKSNKIIAMIDGNSTTDEFLIDVFDHTDAIIIKDGRGGSLDGMSKTLAYLDKHPEKLIVIDGLCASACTMLLSRPANVVYTENAMFGFHSAYWSGIGTMSPEGNDKQIRVFPKAFQEWLALHRAYASKKLTYINSKLAYHYFPGMYLHSSKLPQLESHGSMDIAAN